MRPSLLFPAVLACAALTAPPARAEGKITRATLSWVRLPGAESCIAAPALADAIEERLGHPVFGPAARATLSVEGWVEPAPRPMKWRAVVTVATAKGEVLGTHEIVSEAPDCAEIVPRLSLGIALMVDPEMPAPAEPEPVPAAAPAAPITPPAPAPRAATQVTFGPVIGVGAAPGAGIEAVAPGMLLRVLIGRPASWGIEIDVAFFPPRSIRSEALTETMSTHAYRVHSAALGCPLRLGTTARFELCGGFAGGVMGLERQAPRGLLDAQIAPRLGYRFANAPIVLGLGGALAIPILRPVLFTGNIEYRTPPVYGMADLAVGIELP